MAGFKLISGEELVGESGSESVKLGIGDVKAIEDEG